MPPTPESFAAVLPSLFNAIELQRDAGDLVRPPWPAWLHETIETGGESVNGLHEHDIPWPSVENLLAAGPSSGQMAGGHSRPCPSPPHARSCCAPPSAAA
jgi:hypothetical protein